jgi:hypothetical protein
MILIRKIDSYSNSAYLQTPFTFYTKRDTIDFVELSEIDSIINATLDK